MIAARRLVPARLRWIAVALGAALPAAAPAAFADGVDTSRPATLVVGSPRGFAPSERLDAWRTGRSHARLPSPMREVWRRHISGGIESTPLVDAQGDLVVSLTVPEVVKLAPDGKERWRVRVGTSAPLAPAALTSDGTVALVSAAGVAWGLSPAGGIRFSTPLGIRGRDADVAPLPLDDGGLIVAAGRSLVEVGADGSVRARAEIDNRAVGAPLAGPEGALVTTESGDVLTWRPPSPPRRLGAFGGAPRRGAVRADARRLLAVVDGRRVVALDLKSGTTGVLSGGLGAGAIDGPPAVGAGGAAVFTSSAGLLFCFSASGVEELRVAIDRPPVALPPAESGGTLPGFFAPADGKPSPPLVLDRDGRIAFVRASGRVGVVDAQGNVSIAVERVCSAPLALVPAGPSRVAVACRDGTVVMFEGNAGEQPGKSADGRGISR